MSAAVERLAPTDERACASALAEASAARRTVRTRGAGTKDYLGDLRATDLVIETRRLAGVVDHVPADLTVTVRAGTGFAELQRSLGAAGQFLPLDPPHAATATVGGIVAANSTGFGRLRYGGVRDQLIGSAIALADGTVARAGGRVVKNVAGYDLDKLVVGSLGTLGVVVETTFKVLPLPPARAAAVGRFARAADAFRVADALVRTPLRPAALAIDSRGGRDWRLVVAAEGERAQVERTLTDTRALAAGAGAPVDDAADVDAILRPLRELPATATGGALVRVALPIAAQRAFAETAARSEGFARLVADAGSGIALVHLQGDEATIVASADALFAAARIVGGSARVERRQASLAARLPAWGPALPSGHFLMRRLKDAFDPAGILEPGRSAVG